MNKCLYCKKITANKVYCSRKCGAIDKGKKQIIWSICPCGIKFKAKKKGDGTRVKYHSNKCFGKYTSKDSNARSNGLWLPCDFDGILIYVTQWHIEHHKHHFCNKNCKAQWTTGINHHLTNKLVSIERRKKQKEIMLTSGRAFKKGIENPAYKGGLTKRLSANKEIRRSSEYKEWRFSVFEKDNYTDQKTGKSGGILRAHHIESYSTNPILRFDVNNGITFSEETHITFHQKYGFGNNTREQLEEFLQTKKL